MSPVILHRDWIDSQLSIARFYGGININGKFFMIVPQSGDLVQKEWVGVYKTLGRDRTLELLRSGKTLSDARKEVQTIKLSRKEQKSVRGRGNGQQKDLFDNI